MHVKQHSQHPENGPKIARNSEARWKLLSKIKTENFRQGRHPPTLTFVYLYCRGKYHPLFRPCLIESESSDLWNTICTVNGKWINYDDPYLSYNYKKLTNFQSPIIIPCTWILYELMKKWINYADPYLSYNYKKLTNFQSPIIIPCTWILDLCFLFNISRDYGTKKDPYCITEALHHCRIRKIRFQKWKNGNLEPVFLWN